MSRLRLGCAFGLAAVLASAAPSLASAQAPCAGKAPAAGELRGPVLAVIDGRTLCVARGFAPADWAPVRLDDLAPVTSRGELMAAAFGQNLQCVVSSGADGLAHARCRRDGRPLAEIVNTPAIKAAGPTWR